MATIKANNSRTNIATQAPIARTGTPDISSGIDALKTIFEPKGVSSNAIYQETLANYNTQVTSLEESGNLSNTAIAQLNRQTRLNLQMDLNSKAQSSPQDINAYMTSLGNVFESDDRYTTVIDNGTVQTSSFGDAPKIIYDKELAGQDASAKVRASWGPQKLQLFANSTPEQQAAMIKTGGQELAEQEALAQAAANANAHSDIQDWDDQQKEAANNKIYASVAATSADSLFDEQATLVGRVKSGELTAQEAASLFQSKKTSLLKGNGVLTLQETRSSSLTDLNTYLNTFDGSEDTFRALGTDWDEMTEESKGMSLALEIKQQQAIEGLSTPLQELMFLSNAFAQDPVSLKIFSATLNSLEGGKIQQWKTSADEAMRTKIAPNMQKLVGVQEVTPEVREAGKVVFQTAFDAMSKYTAGYPYEASISATNLLDLHDNFVETNYWESRTDRDKDLYSSQYKNFLEMVMDTVPEAATRYRKLK